MHSIVLQKPEYLVEYRYIWEEGRSEFHRAESAEHARELRLKGEKQGGIDVRVWARDTWPYAALAHGEKPEDLKNHKAIANPDCFICGGSGLDPDDAWKYCPSCDPHQWGIDSVDENRRNLTA